MFRELTPHVLIGIIIVVNFECLLASLFTNLTQYKITSSFDLKITEFLFLFSIINHFELPMIKKWMERKYDGF